MYSNLHGYKGPDRRHRKGVMSVSKNEFHTYELQIPDEVKEDNGKCCHSLIVPLPLITVRNSNDLQY